jgi:antitoxin MazE
MLRRAGDAAPSFRFMYLLNDAVEVREEAGRIVIEPVRPKTYDLADLLKGITKENRHEAVEFGVPQGKEAW